MKIKLIGKNTSFLGQLLLDILLFPLVFIAIFLIRGVRAVEDHPRSTKESTKDKNSIDDNLLEEASIQAETCSNENSINRNLLEAGISAGFCSNNNNAQIAYVFAEKSAKAVYQLIKFEGIEEIRNNIKFGGELFGDGLKYLQAVSEESLVVVSSSNPKCYLEASSSTLLTMMIAKHKESEVNAILEEIYNLGLNINDFYPELLLPYTVISNHPAILKALISYGIQFTEQSVNLIVSNGNWRNLLHVAVECGHVEILQLLLPKMRKWINAYDDEQRTALYVAFQTEQEPAIARLLLQAGANPNIPHGQNLQTPLHEASFRKNAKGVQLLIEYDANPNLVDAKGITPLIIACGEGELEIVKILIDAGASINRPVNIPSIFEAIASGNVEVVKLLVKFGANTNIELKGNTLLHIVAISNSMEAVKFVKTLKIGALYRNYERYLSSEWTNRSKSKDNIERISSFLQQEEQRERKIREKLKAKLSVVRRPNFEAIKEQLAELGLRQKIEFFIATIGEDGIEFPWLYEQLITDLIVLGNHYDVAESYCKRALIRYKEDRRFIKLSTIIQELKNDDTTPYLAYELLFKKSDIDISDIPQIIQQILFNHDVESIKDVMQMDGNFINRIIGRIGAKTKIFEMTPLNYAVYLNNKELLKTLIRLSAVLPTDKNILKAAICATSQREIYPFLTEIAKYFGYKKIMKIIIKTNDMELFNRALSRMQSDDILDKVYLKYDNWVTLLHIAANYGNVEMCRKFVELGIEVDALAKDGMTALAIAANGGDYENFKELLKLGANPLLRSYDENTKIYVNLFYCAIMGKNIKIVKYIIENFAGKMDFHRVVVEDGKYLLVRELVSSGKYKEIADYFAILPYYKKYNLEELWWFKAIARGDVKKMETVLRDQAGREFNFEHYIEALNLIGKSIDKITPLEVAVMYGKTDIVKLFFRFHPENPYNYRKSLLRMAVEQNSPEILSILLENGVKLGSSYKFRLISKAKQHASPEVCKLLLPYFTESEFVALFDEKTLQEWGWEVKNKTSANLMEKAVTEERRKNLYFNVLEGIEVVGISYFVLKWLVKQFYSRVIKIKMRFAEQLPLLSGLLTKNEWQINVNEECQGYHKIVSELEIKQLDGDCFMRNFAGILDRLDIRNFNFKKDLMREMFNAYKQIFKENRVIKRNASAPKVTIIYTYTPKTNLKQLESDFRKNVENFKTIIENKAARIKREITKQAERNSPEYQAKKRRLQLEKQYRVNIKDLRHRIEKVVNETKELNKMKATLFSANLKKLRDEWQEKVGQYKVGQYNEPEFRRFHNDLQAALQRKLRKLNNLEENSSELVECIDPKVELRVIEKTIQELSDDELKNAVVEQNDHNSKLDQLEQKQLTLQETLKVVKRCISEIKESDEELEKSVIEFRKQKEQKKAYGNKNLKKPKNLKKSKKPKRKPNPIQKQEGERHLKKQPLATSSKKRQPSNNKKTMLCDSNNRNFSGRFFDDRNLSKQYLPASTQPMFVPDSPNLVKPDDRLLYASHMLDFMQEALEKLKQLSDSASSNEKSMIFEMASNIKWEKFNKDFECNINSKIACKHIYHFVLLTSIMHMTHVLAQVFSCKRDSLKGAEKEIKGLYAIRNNIMHALSFAKIEETIKLAKELYLRYRQLVEELKKGNKIGFDNSGCHNKYVFSMLEQKEKGLSIENYCFSNVYKLCSMFKLCSNVAEELEEKFCLVTSKGGKFSYTPAKLLHLAMYTIVFGIGENLETLYERNQEQYNALLKYINNRQLGIINKCKVYKNGKLVGRRKGTIFEQQKELLRHKFLSDDSEQGVFAYCLSEPIALNYLLELAKDSVSLHKLLEGLSWWRQDDQNYNYLFMDPTAITEETRTLNGVYRI